MQESYLGMTLPGRPPPRPLLGRLLAWSLPPASFLRMQESYSGMTLPGRPPRSLFGRWVAPSGFLPPNAGILFGMILPGRHIREAGGRIILQTGGAWHIPTVACPPELWDEAGARSYIINSRPYRALHPDHFVALFWKTVCFPFTLNTICDKKRLGAEFLPWGRAPRPPPPGRKGPSQRLVRDHRCWLQPQQAAGDAWCGILGMRRFSPIGEF